MLGYYKYTRKQIVEMILNSPKTTDGFYYMYNFPVLNLMRGKIDGERDSKFFFDRDYFKNKLCFNKYDIDCYLQTTNSNYDIKRMQMIDNKLKDIINDFLELDLNDRIDKCDYTLDELIDTSIYLLNNKY